MWRRVLVLMCCWGCQPDVVQEPDASPFDLAEDPRPIQGLYSVEFEVVEEGCSPSLSELTQSPHLPFGLAELLVNDGGLALVPPPLRRHYFETFSAVDGFDPSTLVPGFTLREESFDTKSMEGEARGSEVRYYFHHKRDVRLEYVSARQMRYHVSLDWYEDTGRIEGAGFQREELFPFLPQDPCRESYVLTMTLDTSCADVDGFEFDGQSSSIEVDGVRYPTWEYRGPCVPKEDGTKP